MDPSYEENPYFQDEYISEEQYISYNEEYNYDYGNNPQGDGENGEEFGYEENFDQEFGYEGNFDQELGYEEDFGQGVEEGEELGNVEVSREWEEEGRGKGWEYDYEEPGQIHQEYQPDTRTDDEMGHGIPYGGSTPPWEHSYPTLDSAFADYTYDAPSQWTHQIPPLSPLLQLETMVDHPYLMPPTTQHCWFMYLADIPDVFAQVPHNHTPSLCLYPLPPILC